MVLNAKKGNFDVEQPGNKRSRSDSDEFDTKLYDYQKPGYDNRINDKKDDNRINDKKDDLEILYNVHNYYQKYAFLKYLQNSSISNKTKYDFVQKNNIFNKTYKYDPLKGGLLEEWNNIF